MDISQQNQIFPPTIQKLQPASNKRIKFGIQKMENFFRTMHTFVETTKQQKENTQQNDTTNTYTNAVTPLIAQSTVLSIKNDLQCIETGMEHAKMNIERQLSLLSPSENNNNDNNINKNNNNNKESTGTSSSNNDNKAVDDDDMDDDDVAKMKRKNQSKKKNDNLKSDDDNNNDDLLSSSFLVCNEHLMDK